MRIKTWFAGVVFALASLMTVPSWAQTLTPQDSVQVAVNVGDPSWATFIFGHPVNGEPGVTELIVQCDHQRAELITNFDVYGHQLVSQFFTVACNETITYQNGVRVITFSLNATPLYESLLMQGRDANGNLVMQNLNLIVDGAQWVVRNPGRWETASGAAEIAY